MVCGEGGAVNETSGGDQTLLSARFSACRSISIPFATLRTSSLSAIISYPECFLFVGMVGGIAFQREYRLTEGCREQALAPALRQMRPWPEPSTGKTIDRIRFISITRTEVLAPALL